VIKQISKTAWVVFVILVAVALVVAYAVGSGIKRDDFLRVYFLDVGQGDAIFVRAPNGNQVLIDGGPTNKVLSELGDVMPFYDRSIDMVVLTHPDGDHLTGLIDVLDRYKVDHVIETGVVCNNPRCLQWDQELRDEKALITFAVAGYKIILDKNTYMTVLHPAESVEKQEFNNVNDTSVVIRLIHKEQSLMLTGDIGTSQERRMVYTISELDSDFLKVGHHGSKTSTGQEFLDAVTPIAAFIQVGERNSYGHPHETVTQRLEKNGIKYYRTDIDGRIELVLDGQNYKVITKNNK
jgi:competence protein ComEC